MRHAERVVAEETQPTFCLLRVISGEAVEHSERYGIGQLRLKRPTLLTDLAASAKRMLAMRRGPRLADRGGGEATAFAVA